MAACASGGRPSMESALERNNFSTAGGLDYRLEGIFVGFGAGIHKEDFVQALRCKVDQHPAGFCALRNLDQICLEE